LWQQSESTFQLTLNSIDLSAYFEIWNYKTSLILIASRMTSM
jgi:hypothetical protein